VATHNLGRVVFWMTGALLSFSLSAVSVRGLSQALNTFEILSIRSGFGLIVMLTLVATIPSLRRHLAPRRMAMHVWRNGTHFVGQYIWVVSLTLLPLATVFALEFTMPMWVALLAIPLLGERLTPSRIASIALGFLGVLVIVRPGMESFQPAALLVLAAALAFALSLIATKQLTADVSTFAIIFWMNLMQFPMAFAGSDPLFLARLGESTWLPALGMGVAGLTSHFCLAKAFRYGDASVVVPIDFMRIPLIALVGWLLYNETVDVFVFLGAGLIVCGVLWNLRAESQRRTVAAPATATEKAHSADA
jgi:drug/metabolite transporter (DMT)-like permease